jgi:hypothetical protein
MDNTNLKHEEILRKLFDELQAIHLEMYTISLVAANSWIPRDAQSVSGSIEYAKSSINSVKAKLTRISNDLDREYERIYAKNKQQSHIWWQCSDDCRDSNCPFCLGGLKYCITCKCAESELTSQCFGEPLTEELKEEVTKRRRDFQDGGWVKLI